MSEVKEIFAGIYGGWKKTDVHDLVVIRCANCDNCSLYQSGCCANVPQWMAPSCPFGKVSRSRGYSQRAASYSSWSFEIKHRPSYNAVRRPSGCFVARINDHIMSAMYCGIYWSKKEGRWDGPNLSTMMTSMPLSEWTPERLHALYRYVPFTLFGSTPVRDYQNERDRWFAQLREIAPEIVSAFLEAYPDIELAPGHIGREAYVSTLRDGSKLMHGTDTWVKSKDKLVCEHCHGFYVGMFGESHPIFRATVPITPAMVYKVTSEDMVDEGTVFVP